MTMTREEQIRKAADDYCGDDTREQSPCFYTHIHNAFLEGIGWADSHPHWIPVEERLPGEGQVVLGVREGGTDVEMYKFMGFNESTDTFDWEWHPYYRAVVDDVTNWMEIVPPRKEE